MHWFNALVSASLRQCAVFLFLALARMLTRNERLLGMPHAREHMLSRFRSATSHQALLLETHFVALSGACLAPPMFIDVPLWLELVSSVLPHSSLLALRTQQHDSISLCNHLCTTVLHQPA